ncbi:uncharacterized protein LOC132707961 isoform X7 [Cylas formicarius]|uniref:uncharacterized protein LOC132707961 isoform X7 n=1 Tax=Cylas formicarius TaxID=197179 RepID=UPI002958B567|nr:uncharacterized protein LOC132707961 isoform X7 [Cylas formicarius]
MVGALAVGLISGCVYVTCHVCLFGCHHWKGQKKLKAQQHGQHIFNISGRVPEQHHCTPDAYLTVEHINVTNQMNKPSCYNDEPPSYEDAIKMVQGGTAHAPATQQPHSAAAIPAVHRLSV